jgi:hypothetical protein
MRQLTATSLGNATGTDGVNVSVGGGVFVGSGVCVGTSVGGGWVGDGGTANVGVSVTAVFDGRLQACMRRASTIKVTDIFDLIISPF